MAGKSVLEKLREICLALPGTRETLTWGSPHFRVGDKIFCGIGDEKGRPAIGFKLEMDHAHAVVQDPRFWRAPYVGHKGWVSMDASLVRDWDEVRALVLESYRLIAPKKLLAEARAERGPAPAKAAGTRSGAAGSRRGAAAPSPRPRKRAALRGRDR